MLPLTQDQIRSSFLNASRSEIKAITFPADFAQLRWEELDYLGWRDPKMPQRGYLVFPADDGTITSAILRAPEGGSGKLRKVLCDLCRDVRCEVEVYLYVARRAGAAGRAGNTLGTLICADFQCSANLRVPVPQSQRRGDWEQTREHNLEGLRHRTARFMAAIRGNEG
ncbi:FBP domain-containing protein [Psychromicrobium xiongbiense]|uniref:FBP domain-containing protein n=1 Tax=Psychromicrobium xiongbiense TaxID=3051184 RepID=UPI00255339D4|nr:FBP domain-containing protein [Psychromicrobium sp. YIM S02556]